MPTRLLREGLLSSDAVNTLSTAAEVLFVRLLLIADDFGRHDARPSILRAKLFPLKLDAVSDADITGWLAECRAVGLVRVYEVDGKPYLEVAKFNQRTRAKVSKCPPPPGVTTADARQVSGGCPADDGHVTGARRPDSETETETEDSCPEPDEPAHGPTAETPVMTLPCKGTGKRDWPLSAAKVREWEEAYPGVNVLAEVRRAKQWLLDNPTKGKTFTGMSAFLGRWLAKEQNHGPKNGAAIQPKPAAKTISSRDLPEDEYGPPAGGAR